MSSTRRARRSPHHDEVLMTMQNIKPMSVDDDHDDDGGGGGGEGLG